MTNRKARRAACKAERRGPIVDAPAAADDLALACFQDGNRLRQQGRLAEAAALYRRSVAARPHFPQALNNLGNALMMLGQVEEASLAWQRAIAADPDYALAHSNLGGALSQQGRFEEALVHLQRALTLKSDLNDALDHLARAQLALGQAAQALQTTRLAIAIKSRAETRKIFVECLRHVTFAADEPELREVLAAALIEPWARPDRMSGPAAALARRNPVLAPSVDAAVKAWPCRLGADALWSREAGTAICADPLLRALLLSAPVCDVALERFLTDARSVLLAQASNGATVTDEGMLGFWCALAQQCFINEYVFALDAGEYAAARRLQDTLAAALADGHDVPPIALAAVGAYLPLHSLPHVASLLTRAWPRDVHDLLRRQVQEPWEEARERRSIPTLTPIEDAVSRAVRHQYEEHPYPRWITIPPSRSYETFEQYLVEALPWWRGPESRRPGPCDILIAGCGTGQHSIDAAQRSKDARVLAIDLSRTSLAYARRKTRALGLANIDYAQADVLKAAAIDRTFDVIESGGVLHHLDDPWAGWRALLTRLRPGGYMFVALYSERGRTRVAQARDMIAARGYSSTADDIRCFRQELMGAADQGPTAKLITSPDFFSMSGCRDLFFHACEHRLTLPQIQSFLRANNLSFLGFKLESQWLQRFRARHPAPAALTDLDLWHEFEMEHPQTFGAMYHFWVQLFRVSASGHTAPPPRRVMKSRRLMPS